MRRASRYARGKRSPGGYLEFVQGDDALPRDARPARGWKPPATPKITQHVPGVPFLIRLLMPFGDVLEGGVSALQKAWQGAEQRESIIAKPLGTLTALGEVFLLKTLYGVTLNSTGIALTSAGTVSSQNATDWHAWIGCPRAIDSVYQATVDTASAFWQTEQIKEYINVFAQWELFHAVMGSIEIQLQHFPQPDFRPEERWAAETHSSEFIAVYPDAFSGYVTEPSLVPNIVHEYGHVFNNRVGGLLSPEIERLENDLQKHTGLKLQYTKAGMGSEVRDEDPIRIQRTRDEPIEEQADMFLHWVYDVHGMGCWFLN